MSFIFLSSPFTRQALAIRKKNPPEALQETRQDTLPQQNVKGLFQDYPERSVASKASRKGNSLKGRLWQKKTFFQTVETSWLLVSEGTLLVMAGKEQWAVCVCVF